MKLLPTSHLDHGLTPDHVEFLLARYTSRTAFFIESFELPRHLPSLLSGLHGPLVGDPPVPDGETFLAIRGTRGGPSRLCQRAPRTTRTITVIAGPSGEEPCVLYTAYGGPQAPREPWDRTLSPFERVDAEAFWKEHALSL